MTVCELALHFRGIRSVEQIEQNFLLNKIEQKRETFFWKKNMKFSKIFLFRKMSHSAEKCKKGDLFLIYKHAFCCKITKIQRGDPLGH